MKTKSRRTAHAGFSRGLGSKGFRRPNRHRVSPRTPLSQASVTSELATAVAEHVPSTTPVITSEAIDLFMVSDIAQLADNYDLVEAVACGLFDQVATPRAYPALPR